MMVSTKWFQKKKSNLKFLVDNNGNKNKRLKRTLGQRYYYIKRTHQRERERELKSFIFCLMTVTENYIIEEFI